MCLYRTTMLRSSKIRGGFLGHHMKCGPDDRSIATVIATGDGMSYIVYWQLISIIVLEKEHGQVMVLPPVADRLSHKTNTWICALIASS